MAPVRVPAAAGYVSHVQTTCDLSGTVRSDVGCSGGSKQRKPTGPMSIFMQRRAAEPAYGGVMTVTSTRNLLPSASGV